MRYRLFDSNGQPLYKDWNPGDILPEGYSIRPFFPGYTFERQKIETTKDDGSKVTKFVMVSRYRDEEVGEGGYVYAVPGMYRKVALLDIASMHPSTIIDEELFGMIFTGRFRDIVKARICIKHKDFATAKTLLGGKLAKYLDDPAKAKQLAKALKIAINSVYGLTTAKFKNPFRDDRNIDNIVAKRGALFMVNLKHEVLKRGFAVAHIKTDSIKIPDATPEIIQFVMDYGKEYGYNFEHEATYDRMCLVNDSTYIARYADPKWCEQTYGYIPSDLYDHPNGEWTATGAQFQVPYVFKKLFSGEDIQFEDMCETKSVNTALYLDFNENLPEGEHDYRFVGKVGLFTPVRERSGGGVLLRESVDNQTGNRSFASANGAKGYRWMEAEIVKSNHMEDAVDHGYYIAMADEAVETLSKFCDVEQFRFEPLLTA